MGSPSREPQEYSSAVWGLGVYGLGLRVVGLQKGSCRCLSIIFLFWVPIRVLLWFWSFEGALES